MLHASAGHVVRSSHWYHYWSLSVLCIFADGIERNLQSKILLPNFALKVSSVEEVHSSMLSVMHKRLILHNIDILFNINSLVCKDADSTDPRKIYSTKLTMYCAQAECGECGLGIVVQTTSLYEVGPVITFKFSFFHYPVLWRLNGTQMFSKTYPIRFQKTLWLGGTSIYAKMTILFYG